MEKKVFELRQIIIGSEVENVADILSSSEELQNIYVPEVSCTGVGGAACKGGCVSSCKSSVKTGVDCSNDCKPGCSDGCKDGCKGGCKSSQKDRQ